MMKRLNKLWHSIVLVFILIFSVVFTYMDDVVLVNAGSYELNNPAVNSCYGTTWNTVYFGNYYQSDTTGTKKEPILWRVLQVCGHDAFLIADKNLDTIPYNSNEGNVTWESCSLRKWLNTTFLDTAFTKQEQEAIIATDVANSDNSYFGTSGGMNTSDKIYLLSLSEAEQLSYGFYTDVRFANNARKAVNTAYLANKLGQTATVNYSCWWLRSPGYVSSYAARINENGYGDIYGLSANTTKFAVRPVLHLNLGYFKYWKKGSDVVSNNDISVSKTVEISNDKDKVLTAKPKQASIISIKRIKAKNCIKIKYKKLNNVIGYQIQYATNARFKKKKNISSKKNNLTVKKLAVGKYYFRVRGYNLNDGKKQYGRWSKIKTIKVK